jgi:hypothetical protein
MIFAAVVEPKDALGIFTLADSWVVGRSEEVGGIMRYGDQKIPRLFQYPTRLRSQPPLGLHYLRLGFSAELELPTFSGESTRVLSIQRASYLPSNFQQPTQTHPQKDKRKQTRISNYLVKYVSYN